jgi:hypothetical protein
MFLDKSGASSKFSRGLAMQATGGCKMEFSRGTNIDKTMLDAMQKDESVILPR